MDTLIKISADQETPSIFWFGTQLAFIVDKPEDMKAVLTSPNCLQKLYVYDFFRGTNGLFNSPGTQTKFTVYLQILENNLPLLQIKTHSSRMEKGSKIHQSNI